MVFKKCEWGKFIVFELKCYLINVNGVIECELKTAKKIITNKIRSNLITNALTSYTNVLTNVHLQRLSAISVQLGAGKPAGALCMVHA